MKTKLKLIAAFLLLCTLNPQLSTLFAQSSAFTYQGRLTDNAAPANGVYDLQFALYGAASGGTAVAGPLGTAAVPVSNGLFTAILDFGSAVFDGSARWLELGVRTNGSLGAYSVLTPRQELTATPYAIRSASAATAGTAATATTAAGFSGPLAGDVTGPQGATVVAAVGGQTAANLASGANAANAAASANTSGAIVKRDGSGNFAAGTITGDLSGNAATATTANNFSGLLGGDVTGTQGATAVASVGGQTAASLASGATAANAATDANVPGTIVKRDGSGEFAAGSISAGSVSAGTLAGDGASVTNLNGLSIVAGTVGNMQLASGAAVANLLASGQSAVPSGGIIFSANPASSSLVDAGYTRVGKTVLGVDTWDQRPAMPLGGRYYHAAVWTGTEMIIWGGSYYDGAANHMFANGARYNAASNAWTTINTNGAPSPRNPAAVWTGREMIIWGGSDTVNQGGLGNGARYDPSTDSWSAMSTNGAPSPRTGHTATWTGNELIIWGGLTYSGGNYVTLGDGARYDPLGDTWAPMASNSVVATRYNHTGIWTGGRVIVWGGYSYDGSYHTYGDGAAYDPASNTWNAISTNGAPSPRYMHTAVWNGSEMLIWGGTVPPSATTVFGDGAKYNPSNDTWRPIPTTGAPTGRYGQTAVWTGSEMIIWGGYNSSFLNTGSRYSPAANTWQAMTLSAAPSARYIHSAVWTGAEMLVAVGETAFWSFANDLLSYTPPATL